MYSRFIAKYSAWLAIFLFLSNSLAAQRDYDAVYRSMRPELKGLSPKEAINTLEEFLNNKQIENDTIGILHGKMYLATELFQSDFVKAMEYLLSAETIALVQSNDLLLGRIFHKKGTLYTVMHNYPEAIEQFESALSYGGTARDSQNIAITLEQLGAVYGYQKNYEKANDYYKKAIPLVEEHCRKKELAATYSNYGNILSYQGLTQQAIDSYKKALALNEELGDTYQSVPCRQNLAWEYLHLGKPQTAMPLYWKCLTLNRENEWWRFMIYTYLGLSDTHESIGNIDSALFYHQAYHELQDSIIGADVQQRVSALESALDIKRKEFELLQQKEALAKQKIYNRNLIIGFTMVLALVLFIMLTLYLKRKQNLQRLTEHRESLANLTNVLKHKNAELRDSNEKFIEVKKQLKQKTKEAELNINTYDLRILTTDDWYYFKALFEKSYPGFLQKIRTNYSEISEAEERLFLLLKLKLSNREIADTLGIQADSVKKTRNRLRKRLDLDSRMSLDKFISQYN